MRDDLGGVEREDSRQKQTVSPETTRLESIIKMEFHRLETTIERGFKEQLKWLIVLLLGFASLIITVIKLL